MKVFYERDRRAMLLILDLWLCDQHENKYLLLLLLLLLLFNSFCFDTSVGLKSKKYVTFANKSVKTLKKN